MADPATAEKLIRVFKLRADVRALEAAAAIASDMDCHALANSLHRLASIRESEARALTRVSSKEKNDQG